MNPSTHLIIHRIKLRIRTYNRCSFVSKKGKNQHKHRPDTLTCIRDDGSATWMHIHRGFVQHDFAHYVVETTLGFQDSFFGLVAKGYNIPDFSLPTSKTSVQNSERSNEGRTYCRVTTSRTMGKFSGSIAST